MTKKEAYTADTGPLGVAAVSEEPWLAAGLAEISTPEFCPNPGCPYYDRAEAAKVEWFRPHGSFYTQCRGDIRRFRWATCGKTCSTQTFSIHYWTHSTTDLTALLQQLSNSGGLRQISRTISAAYRVVQNRIRRIARNCLALMDMLIACHTLEEDQAMDGFESYTRSQYHPNNITMVVGSKSQLIYGSVHTLLRRKGRMTDGQKRMRDLIDQVWKPKPDGIKKDCANLLSDLSLLIATAANTRPSGQVLHTDEHTAYPRALRAVPVLRAELERGRLRHQRTSSRAPRIASNPLFSVNYVDRQIRKDMGEHVRETVKQGREVNCQMERIAIFMMVHNFLQPHRVHDKANPWEGPRHAEVAGVDHPEIAALFPRLATHRHVYGQLRANPEWIRRIWQHDYENPPAVKIKKKRLVVTRVALGRGELPAHLLA